MLAGGLSARYDISVFSSTNICEGELYLHNRLPPLAKEPLGRAEWAHVYLFVDFPKLQNSIINHIPNKTQRRRSIIYAIPTRGKPQP